MPTPKEPHADSVEPPGGEFVETAAEAVTETAVPDSEEVVPATSDLLRDASAGLAETVAETSEATAQAFEAARTRLQSLTGTDQTLPGLEPFTMSGDLFRGAGSVHLTAASNAISAFNARALEAWRTNTQAALVHMQSLAGVRTLSEAISLNSEFARRQLEQMSEQSREFMALASRLTRSGKDPGSGVV